MCYMEIIPETAPKSLTSETNFSNYLLIVDAYLKNPKKNCMEIITTEKLMDKLDMFKSRFGKVEEFGWWDWEIISSDSGTQSTSTGFQDNCQTCSVHLTAVYLEHQEMNGKVEVTWIMLCMISHSHMVHEGFLESYIHFVLMYTEDHIFLVLLIKDLINEDGKDTTPLKLEIDMKPSIT